MRPRLSQPWIPLDRIEALVQLEPALVLLGLAASAWFVYKLLLKAVSEQRHLSIQAQFRNLCVHLGIATGLFVLFTVFSAAAGETPGFTRVASYIGLFTIIWGCIVFVKTARMLILEYLFFGHMREGVPILLVNLFTLLLSLTLGGWVLTEVFALQVAPLLATSAIFSIVLGLALQDTLGNLFAGVALQFDKPYELGDWVEVQNGSQKWVGQVYEITWRATSMTGLSDEIITIPNRVISQAQVSNFSVKHRPIVRTQTFRLPYGAPIEQAKAALLEATSSCPKVLSSPAPLVIVTESAESWVTLRLCYFIQDYGSQWATADQVIESALKCLNDRHIPLAAPRIDLQKASCEKAS